MNKEYTVYENGQYIKKEYTDEEVQQIQIEQQKEQLSQTTTIAESDIMNILMQSVQITLPSGETKSANELVNTEIELPMKVGYRWELQGTTFVLVKDENAVGTENNPIYWVDDGSVPLIDNAYYLIDGVRNVYMQGQFIEF